MSDYYDRLVSSATDGTPVFATDEDRSNEAAVASALSGAWKCEVRPFGKLAAIDYYATRHGRMVSVIEIKTRTHASSTYETVFLNVRKWLALMLAGCGFGIPALFVVQFTDGIRWVDVATVAGEQIRVAGCRARVKSHADVEPIIEVPVASMRELAP